MDDAPFEEAYLCERYFHFFTLSFYAVTAELITRRRQHVASGVQILEKLEGWRRRSRAGGVHPTVLKCSISLQGQLDPPFWFSLYLQ